MASDFLGVLGAIVGPARVLADPSATKRFSRGFRFGQGRALAVVQPGTLVELWHVLLACVAAGKIIIMQAANTGLTGGSTPDGDDYDADVVIISSLRISAVYPIDCGRQVLCLAGATLNELERVLAPLGREPHSVIGSSCIGASVVGGVCNNSGGSLIRRGPAYTEMALFARLDESGALQLVNHLGVDLGDDPETILERLDRGRFSESDIVHDPARRGSDPDYERRIRDIEADLPCRFNADSERLLEASGCAGKVAVLAVRLDTFARDGASATFYVGTNSASELTALRRDLLCHLSELPVAAEYVHRDAFNIAEKYGKDTFLAVRLMGTRWLPRLFAWKAAFDRLAERLGRAAVNPGDRLLQMLASVLPSHLPPRMRVWRDKYEHHLLLRMSGKGIVEAANYLNRRFPTADGDFFRCTDSESAKAFLHRFAVAGAAVRYRAVHPGEVEDIVALDFALRAKDLDWFEPQPAALSSQIVLSLYYGHFFCYVFHHDYIVKKGCDALALEHSLCQLLDERRAEYPAEHNVGHLYKAKPVLSDFYRRLDPLNRFNPGIGQTSKKANWQ